MNKEKIVEVIIEELIEMEYTISTKKEETQKMYKSGFFTQKRYIESYTSLPKGKKLITEYDIKQILKQNPNIKEIKISKDTIISPLAEDFISSHNIKIIKE